MSREFLESIPLFSGLDPRELEDIAHLAEPFAFESEHRIFDQGVAADGMYVLEAGRVQLWARLLGDEEVLLTEVGPGGVLGEFALIDRGARSARAHVVEPTRGLFLSNRTFELLRADHRSAAQKVMQELRAVLCQRLRAAAQELSEAPAPFYQQAVYRRPPYQEEGGRGSAQTGPRPHPTPAKELDPQRVRVLPFFSAFSERELGELLAPLSTSALPRGHVLLSEGDEGSSSFVVVRGAVEVVCGNGELARRIAILGPGRLFGLVAPLDGKGRSASVVVRENAIVLEIPRPKLERLMQADTHLGEKFVDAVHTTLIDALRGSNRTLLVQAAMGRASRRQLYSPSSPPP